MSLAGVLTCMCMRGSSLLHACRYEATVAQLTGALQEREAEVQRLQERASTALEGQAAERAQWAEREGEWRRRLRGAEEEGKALAGEGETLRRRHEGELQVRVWDG